MRALVTGGTGKLGSAIVARLEQEGWQVFAAGTKDGDLGDANAARTLVERAYRDIRGLCIGAGTIEIQKNYIGSQIVHGAKPAGAAWV